MKRPEKINGGYQPSSLHHGEGTPKPPKGGTGKTEPKHTFPTWEEFQEWSPFVHQDTKVIYDYFPQPHDHHRVPESGRAV
jgi:hypothetical protein